MYMCRENERWNNGDFVPVRFNMYHWREAGQAETMFRYILWQFHYYKTSYLIGNFMKVTVTCTLKILSLSVNL